MINAISACRSALSSPILAYLCSSTFFLTNALYSIFTSLSFVRSSAISLGFMLVSLRRPHASTIPMTTKRRGMGEIAPGPLRQTPGFLRPSPVHAHGVGNAGRYNCADMRI